LRYAIRCGQVLMELLAAGRKTLSRVLVLVVSMGFGVVK
jgi:hypothetical protein